MERILKLTKNARLELTVESFGAEGEGVCRHEGMAVFVPRALPGERIIAQITRVESAMLLPVRWIFSPPRPSA